MFWNKKQTPYVVNTISKATRSKIDDNSETWFAIVEYIDAEIIKLRSKNDNHANTETQTAVIRGSIKALKKIADLPKAKKGILSELAD